MAGPAGPTGAGPPEKRGPSLSAFDVEALRRLPGPGWLADRRCRALQRFEARPWPTEAEELWRYSPIERLDVASYAPLLEPPGPRGAGPAGGLDVTKGSPTVTVAGGWPTAVVGNPTDGCTVAAASSLADGSARLGEQSGEDAPSALHDAFLPDAVVVDVRPGAVVAEPLVVAHWSTGGATATFPHVVVRLGEGAEATVVEVVAGGDGRALVMPVTTLEVAHQARLSYASVQVLGPQACFLGRLRAEVGADATLRAFTAGLGAAYDRMHTEVTAHGRGGSSELCSLYLGTGDQVHDVRILQDHAAAHTTSNLLCKGAVTASSRSIYSGLIKVRQGAVRTDAMQTNHNLVLGNRAHADSVPNLDIEENDVRCSHASTVGPVDADQLYYLESRGIPPERAERLVVLGFFDDVVDRCPVPSVRGPLRLEVGQRLAQGLSAEPERDGAAMGVGGG